MVPLGQVEYCTLLCLPEGLSTTADFPRLVLGSTSHEPGAGLHVLWLKGYDLPKFPSKGLQPGLKLGSAFSKAQLFSLLRKE